ncbi:MAG TPA: hypothetical protein VMH38_02590 [Thermoplasmata archaeon]|nr:hypothetical protein [Thermoplasmata archaeon]
MAVALRDLPKFLVLEPESTIRMEMLLAAPACEIDVELDNPRPGRSFVLLIGHKGGPYVQRVRLAGKARIYFDPESPGEYVLLVSNPQAEPIVLRLRARDIGPRTGSARAALPRPKRNSRRARRRPKVSAKRGAPIRRSSSSTPSKPK